MNDKFSNYFIGLSLLLASFSLSAQTIFDVELVFFKRIGDLHLTGQPEPIQLEADEIEYQLSDSEAFLPEGYTLLNRTEQKLEGVYRRLRVSSDMRPLLHIGWRQELQDKADTPWLSFMIKDDPEQQGLEGFEGIIRLSRNQGLVLESQIVGYKEPKRSEFDDTDSEFQESGATFEDVDQQAEAEQSNELDLPFSSSDKATQENAEVNTSEQAASDFNAEENMQIPDELSGFFEMSETIKVKLDNLYYIDHPTMGLLVKVTPYQAKIEEQEALN